MKVIQGHTQLEGLLQVNSSGSPIMNWPGEAGCGGGRGAGNSLFGLNGSIYVAEQGSWG